MIWNDDDRTPGMEFPSAYDRARIADTQDKRRLWQSDHEDVFTRIESGLSSDEAAAVRKHWASLKYINANLLGLLSRDTSEHLGLEPSTITADDDAAQLAIDRVRDASMWDSNAIDMFEEASALGGFALKVYRDGSDRYIIDHVSPDSMFRGEDYFPEYAALNQDPRKCIAPMAASIHYYQEAWHVLLEIHEPGAVVWRAYQWSVDASDTKAPTFADKGTLGRDIDPAEIMPMLADAGGNRMLETFIDSPTMVLVRNENNAYDLRYGKSDYSRDLVDLQGQFEDKLSTLMRHFHELVNGGTTVLPLEAQAMVMRRGPKGINSGATDFGRSANASGTSPTISADEMNVIFEDAQSKGSTRHVSRSAQYDGGLKSLQIILSIYERLSGMTIDKLLEQSAAPESGRAMRLARARDIKRVKRKATKLARPLATAFEIALALQGIDVRVTYSFPEPFPAPVEDRYESIERATQAPFMTTETGLMEILGWSAEDAASEAEKLQGERHAMGASSTIMGAFGSAAQAVSPNEIAEDTEDTDGEE